MSGALAPGWSVINHTEAGNDKYWSASGTDMTLSYHRNYPKDDYLISPQIQFEAGVEYVISYTWKGGSSSYPEKVSVYLSPSNTDVSIIKSSTCLYNADVDGNLMLSSATKITKKITPSESAGLYVVFYAYTDQDKLSITVSDLMVAKNEFAPAGVTGLKATPGANRELSCKLEWTLPTNDIFGIAIPEDKPITEVKVYRDGKLVENTNLDGTATSFTDTESTGLTSGKHTYGVSVVAGDVEGAQTQVGPTAYVGPITPFNLPVNLSINSADDFGLWTTAKGTSSTDDKDWTYSTSHFAEYSGKYHATDDSYLISAPVIISEAGYYRFNLEISKNNANFEMNVTLEMGESADPSALSPICDAFDLPNDASSSPSPFKTVNRDIKIETPGTYYFAIHGNSYYSGGNGIKFRSLSIEKTSLCPNPVTDLTAKPDANEDLKVNISWTNPTKSTSGETLADSDYQVEIYLNDDKDPVKTVDGGVKEATIEVPEAQVYTVTVKAVGTNGGAIAPEFPSVKTTWVGPRTVPVPYTTEFAEEDGTRVIWESHNLNNDKVGFTLGKYNYNPYYCYFELKGGDGAKDYLVSPVFDLTAGLYKVNVGATGSYGRVRNPIIGLIKNGTFNSENVSSNFVEFKQLGEVEGSSIIESSFTFQITEPGKYQIVYGIEDTNNSEFRLRTFSIAPEEATPADVTDLKAEISETKENTVELSWTNPSKIYDTDYNLSSIGGVVIMRDGEEIATLSEGLTPGTAASYTDENVDAGVHTYTVYVTLNGKGHIGEYPSVSTSWIGGGLTVGEAGIHHEGAVFPGWTTEDVDGNNGVEGVYSWKYSDNGYWQLDVKSYNETRTNNDYLVSCPIKVEKNAIYKVTYDYRPPSSGYSQSKACTMSIKMGSDADHKNFAEVSQLPFVANQSQWTVAHHSFYFAVGPDKEQTEPEDQIMTLAEGDPTPEELYAQAAKVQEGDNRIAIHANSTTGGQIRGFHVEKVAAFDPTTEIEEVGIDSTVKSIYDLNGRKLNAPTKGINIINGQKVIVK